MKALLTQWWVWFAAFAGAAFAAIAGWLRARDHKRDAAALRGGIETISRVALLQRGENVRLKSERDEARELSGKYKTAVREAQDESSTMSAADIFDWDRDSGGHDLPGAGVGGEPVGGAAGSKPTGGGAAPDGDG